jgi:hypothetical protein
MSVTAPPHRPDSTAATEQDRFEALIEEARQRARRRRQTYGAVAVGIVAVVGATVAISGPDATNSEPSHFDTPAGAAGVAAPAGELVASMHLWHVLGQGPDFWLYLYDDGRLISLTGNGAWREQRLTPEAVAGVQNEIISTGLFDPDRRPLGSHGRAGNDIQVRNGDRLVNLPLADGQDWTPAFVRLAGRLATLQSWLPATAWEQSEATSYVPARYAVCAPNTQTDPRARAALLSRIPAAAAAVLKTASVPAWDEMLPEIDPAGHQRRGDDGLCFELPADQAHRVAQSLDKNVDLSSRGHGYLEFDAPGAVTIGLLFIAILPHGAPECGCYG